MALFSKRKKLQDKLLKEQQKGSSIIAYTDPQSIIAEQFRALRTNVEFAQIDKELRSILVSSSIPAEGKSTISANLALVMAQTEKKVLLVDADLRKPTIHRTFKLNNEKGLTTLISNPNIKFNEIVQKSNLMNMYFLTSGPIPPNPSEMLGSASMSHLMKELEKYFDIIIYDAPPITAVTDPQILATLVDGVVLVVRHSYVRREEVRQAKKILTNVNANILGYVMNGKPTDSGEGYYSYYGYGYGSERAQREQ